MIKLQAQKKELVDAFIENNEGSLAKMNKEDIMQLFTMDSEKRKEDEKMNQKMGVSGLKKILKTKEKEELVQIICDMYKDNKTITTYLESQLNGQNYNRELVNQYRQNIYKQLDYTRSRFDFKKAKTLVKEFCTIVKDKQSQADIYFTFVDAAIDLTVAIGDINERFYCDVIDMFWKYVDIVNQLDDSYVQAYQNQLENILRKSGVVGWDLEDGLLEAYANISGLDV